VFEANAGQFPEDVRFVARGPGYRLVLGTDDTRYDLGVGDGHRAIRVTLAGSRTPRAFEATDPLPGRIHYYRGNDPGRWIRDVPTFGRVTLREVIPGIDLVYRAQGGRAEYDFVLSAGSDPSRIAMRFDGADEVSIDAEGRLALQVDAGVLLMAPPVAYQLRGQEREPVEVAFAAADAGGIGFRLGVYDRSRTLVIDPVVLEYSTALGGSADDFATGLQVGADGTLYVSGRTLSADFQGGPGALAGLSDVFVSRISADGKQLLYTTIIGGSEAEFPLDLVVNGAGDAFVLTQTPSANLPMLNAFDATLGGMSDYALIRLDSSGALAYSTYYGGPGEEGAFEDGGIALAPNGDAYITGRTKSLPPNGISLSNAFQTSCVSQCAFVAGFDTDLSGASSLVYGSYVGGNADDGGQDIEVDASGRLYLFGFTSSNTALVDSAQSFQPATNDAMFQDNFLLVLDPNLSGLAQRVYSTYLGSPGAEAEPRGGLFLESPSAVFVTGATDGNADTTPPYAAGFPIKNALQPTPGGMEDAYVAKIDTTTTGDASLVFSTFLGGAGTDSGSDIVTDSTGRISVALQYSSWTNKVAPLAEFPFASVRLAQLDATGQTLMTATPLPDIYRVAVDAQDRLLVAGNPLGTFAQVGALPASPAGGREIFLARLSSLPLTGATLSVDATTPLPGVNEDFAYRFTLTNNGAVPITDFTLAGDFPSGLSKTLSSLCNAPSTTISCVPPDPSAFAGVDAIQPNERLTLFGVARSAGAGAFDIASITATTTPADPDPSDNNDGVDVDVVASPPPSSALSIADFDASGLAYPIGGFAVDTPLGVLASSNGVQDSHPSFMVFDGQFPVYVGDVYSRGRLAIGFVERASWTPSDGDGMSLLDIDSGFGTVDRVYAEITPIGRGTVANVSLRSGNAFSPSVAVPGATTKVGLEPDKAFDLVLDPIAQTATLSYGGQALLSGNPFSSALPGGADVGDVGDDMVISVGGGRIDLGGALFSDQPISVPEPSIVLGTVVGALALALRRR
jgi:hypothetical protein